ncbi:CUB and sushi domain-containing protein 1-like isoform X7 [Sebastes umbrosus]|uniref:CUB and sushi domain-containing protein 1-like isoform X7 n=1 Tax=Sebastes umbrosus TaxID=72105 RepID=UPI0018A01BBE|nr:CUB and sushi domain-containing protein 1-like isoform X7 [Sebastes umbrosus]
MYVGRYLGFVLLVWFPGALHAQSANVPCRAPRLNGGYLVPEQDTYPHGTKLTYACDNGRKPAVEGWWATSTCLNGTWSHEPQCIDEKACMPPTIPNAIYTENTNGWYEERDKIWITCNEGYEHKNRDATAECVNGTWSSVPICEKSIHACGDPPQIPHAIIIDQEYQEVFPGDTEVQYECEDGYTVEGAEKSIYCIAGNWTEGPKCSRGTRPGTGHGGSGVGGAGGGSTTSTGSGTQPAGSRPGTGDGGSAGGGHTTSTGSGTQPVGGGSRPGTGDGGSAGGGHTTSTGSGTQPVGGGSRPDTGDGGSAGRGHTTSTGRGTPPVGGGSSGSSGLNEMETEHQITTIRNCGNHPVVPNGDVVGNSQRFLRYQCAQFYKRVGPEDVVCYSDGTWSEVPTCRAAFCSVNTDEYPQLIPGGVKYIKDGETVRLECVHLDHWWTTHYSVGRCTFGRLSLSRCCDWLDLKRNKC